MDDAAMGSGGEAAGRSHSKRKYIHLGRMLASLRQDRTRLSRRQFAALIGGGATAATIVAYENGYTRPSAARLRKICDLLNVAERERQRAFALADYGTSGAPEWSADPVPAALAALVIRLSPLPSQLSNERWQYVAWNRISEVIFNFTTDERYRDAATAPKQGGAFQPHYLEPAHRNPLYIVHHPNYGFAEAIGSREVWNRISRNQLAWFRYEVAPYEDAPWVTALKDDLRSIIPDFNRRWDEAQVYNPDEYGFAIPTPLGAINFRSVVMRFAAMPAFTMVTYVPIDSSDTDRLWTVAQTRAQTDPELARELNAHSSIELARSLFSLRW